MSVDKFLLLEPGVALVVAENTCQSPTGIRRSIALLKAFRLEQSDPAAFYQIQAEDTMMQIERDLSFEGACVLDVGGGPGFFSKAMQERGASVVLVEPGAGEQPPEKFSDPHAALTEDEAHRKGTWPGKMVPNHTVAGDGYVLPFASETFDVVFSSNVLEHVADPERFIKESIRVTKPGGIVYISYTVWLSPNGGHETSPWHFIGGHFARRRFEKKNGKSPKNVFGESMFACYVRPVLKIVERLPTVEVVRAEPRHYPSWMRWVVKVPLLNEVLTQNLALTLRVTA
jgi:SAM-dependent methyltransferase